MIECHWNVFCDRKATLQGEHAMKDSAILASQRGMSTTENDILPKKESLTTYWQVVNYLILMYAAEGVTIEVLAVITAFKKLCRMSAVKYSKFLLTKTIRRGRVYEEERFYGVLMKLKHQFFRFSTRLYRVVSEVKKPQMVERYGTSLFKLQVGGNITSTSWKDSRYDQCNFKT